MLTMRFLNFYRYISNSEKGYIRQNKRIQTNNLNALGTYYTPDRFDDPVDVQSFLSLRKTPENRVGPISRFALPVFDVIPLRITPPAHGQPGGAYEACTSHPVYIFGIYNFNHNIYEM